MVRRLAALLTLLLALLLPARPHGSVVVVAHNPGDHVAVARRDLAAGADVVEIDVRCAGGELVAAHAPPPEGRAFRGPSLAEAWRVAARRRTVLLHLKERSPAYLARVRAFVRAQPPRHLVV